MVNPFTLFKKKAPAPKERKPLNLPEITEDKMTLVNISAMINEGIPIWTWTSMLDKWNTTAMLNMRGDLLDGFAMFRKEQDFLIKYVAIVGSDHKSMTLKIREICKCSNSNILELINTEFADAYKVYYDDAQLTENLQYYVHDLDADTINEYLEKNRLLHVSEEHFVKKKDIEEDIEI